MNEDKTLKAICGSPDQPIKIGNIEIPCYVLEGDKRVLIQKSMTVAMGMKHGSGKDGEGDRLVKFISTKAISSYISDDLSKVIRKPLKFRTTRGSLAYGYEATVLADLCDAVLESRKAGDLNFQQSHIADNCELLVRGFARVGIIALVDEATGYQHIRARNALEEIFEKFISKELRKWTKTFPDEFYQEMFRLKGWQYMPFSIKRPGVVGNYTNDLVYERLAPGVLEELKRKNPAVKPGRRQHRHFQWLTENVGHPKLREHLTAVIALMKASSRWDQFYRMLQKAFPKLNEQLPLDLKYPGDD